MEFQEVARHWKRMCKQYRKPNTCHGCPIAEHQKMFEACSDGDVDTVAMEALVMSWAAEHPEPVYPTWGEWLEQQGICFSRLTNYSRVDGISIPQVFNYQIEAKQLLYAATR